MVEQQAPSTRPDDDGPPVVASPDEREPLQWHPDGFVPLAPPPRDPNEWEPPPSAFVGLGVLFSMTALACGVLGGMVPGVGRYSILGYVGTYAVALVVIFRRREYGPDRRIAEIGLGVLLPYLILLVCAVLSK